MLDPLTALSVAGTIVQFVDFSGKLLAKSREIYKSASGASIDNNQLEAIAKDLEGLNARLRKPLPSQQSLGESDTSLVKLGEQCAGVAAELILALEELKVRGATHLRWKSFRKALKSVRKREEVDAITLRLRSFREELNLHILVNLRYVLQLRIYFLHNECATRERLKHANFWPIRDTLDIHAIEQTQGFRNLDEDARVLAAKLQDLQDDKEEFLGALAEHTSRVLLAQDRTNKLITAEHQRTRVEIRA
jgi:hypothetical protein